jgi:hypothetical protein
MSTLFASDRVGQPPDCPGLRMFPPLPIVSGPQNRVRVPPRAQYDPSSEGFLLYCVDIAPLRVPLTLSGVCARRRGRLFG